MQGCLAHHPSIEAVLPLLQALLDENLLEGGGYQRQEGGVRSALRSIQLAVERRSGLIQLGLMWNAAHPSEVGKMESLVDQLWNCEVAGARPWNSVWGHFQEEPPPSKVSKWLLLKGSPEVTEEIDGLNFRFGPGFFRQANLEILELIVRDTKAALKRSHPSPRSDLRLLELYGGASILGLSLLSVCGPGARLLSTGSSLRDEQSFAAQAKAVFGNDWESRAAFRTVEAAEAAARAEDGFNVVVLDPPRSGMGQEVVTRLVRSASVETIVHLSNGPRAFMAEAQSLFRAGFRPTELRLYDAFPGTQHVEVLGVYARALATGHWRRFTPGKTRGARPRA